MKYGKYDLRKSSTNVSVGTSYSWYYKKNDTATAKKKKKKLVRTASDSTLFSDYANQIIMFDNKNKNKKCKKTISNTSKNRIKVYNVNLQDIKPVQLEPFTGNFYYGDPLPGFEFTGKSEEKITYLPDSDGVSPSEETVTTLGSITTAPTVVDAPELVKNPLYGCHEADSQLTAAEYFTDTNSKDSQLNTSSCTEIKETMCSSKDSDNVYESILKDFKRSMKEWNNTIMDHYNSESHTSKNTSSMDTSNTSSYFRSLHSTLSCRKYSKNCLNSNKSYDYAFVQQECGTNTREKCKHSNLPLRKSQTLDRNQTFNTNNDSGLSATLRNLKKKAAFWKDNVNNLKTSNCDCLETIYANYDRRLQECYDSLSSCSTLIGSTVRIEFIRIIQK